MLLVSSLLLVVAYFIGSIPFGLLVANFAGIDDITKKGSGNIGATNVLRIGGKKLGAVTLILDSLKGALLVLLVFFCQKNFPYEIKDVTLYYCGFCVILGHVFPVWLNFKGGKGVATALGVISILNPIAGVIFITVWMTVFLLFRFSSLSSILALLSSDIYIVLFDKKLLWLFLAITALVLFRHRDNIQRLINGTEAKFHKIKS